MEDSATDARLMLTALARGPRCTALHATDLVDALDHLAEGVDLVLLDLHLPGSRGLETLHRVLEASPGTPVIVVTGSEDEGLADLALRHGAEDFIVKGTPRFVSVLRLAVQQAIERVHLLEALRAGAPRRAPFARVEAFQGPA